MKDELERVGWSVRWLARELHMDERNLRRMIAKSNPRLRPVKLWLDEFERWLKNHPPPQPTKPSNGE